MRFSTAIILLFTLVSFAANSILCRLALADGAIGPLEFTLVRLGSGVLFLLPILILPSMGGGRGTESDWKSRHLSLRMRNYWQAASLFGYAFFFSLAYVELEAATGALILFPTVQISMIGFSMLRGNRLTMIEAIGFGLSLGGLIYLLAPGVSAPPMVGTIMMILSGVCWSAYSLLGSSQSRPIMATARNFLFCWPFLIILMGALLVGPFSGESVRMDSNGLGLAILSGGVASGVGYILWYLTLARITTTQASVAQLAVPVIAAAGGIIFLGEALTSRLVVSSLLILGGVTLTISGRTKRETVQPTASSR